MLTIQPSSGDVILFPPHGTFWTVDIVFANRPTEKVAYETAIAELTKAVQRAGGSKNITAYVSVGPRQNRAGRQQMKGSNGHYISVEFTAKTRKVTNGDGEILPVQIDGDSSRGRESVRAADRDARQSVRPGWIF